MSDPKEGTFIVTGADDASAVLQDVHTGQVHTLAGNPDLAEGEAVEATLAPEPEMEVVWRAVEVADRWTIEREHSPERPTRQAREAARDQAVGELTRQERAGEGEVHVITVPADGLEAAAEDVLEDGATLTRAARLGVGRVEVRTGTAGDAGVLSVRYLP